MTVTDPVHFLTYNCYVIVQ